MKSIFFLLLFSLFTKYTVAQPTIEWEKTFGGSNHDYASSIQQTTDGGYIVAGKSWSNDGDVSSNYGLFDYWIIKLTNTGDVTWKKSFGGSGLDDAKFIQQTFDGGCIVAGISNSNDGDIMGGHGANDCWIIKLDSLGTIEWQKTLGGTSTENCNSIQQTIDSGYVIAGSSNSTNGDVSGGNGASDFWIVKLTSMGNIEWQKTLGGSNIDIAYSVKQTIDGGYIVAGETKSNNGDVTDNHGGFDYWIVKLSPVSVGINETKEPYILNIYPNPTNSYINIKTDRKLVGAFYTIYNHLGKALLSGNLIKENTQIDIGNLPVGIYILSVGNSIKQNFKIIKY